MLILDDIPSIRGIRHDRRIHRSVTWPAVDKAEQKRALQQAGSSLGEIDYGLLARHGFWDESEQEPVRLLVSRPQVRVFDKNVHVRVIAEQLPAGSLLRVEPGLYCLSPGYAAIRYLAGRSFAMSFMLLMELLGTYTLSPDATIPIDRGGIWPDWRAEGRSSNEENDQEESEIAELEAAVIEQIHNKCDPALTPAQLKRFIKTATGNRAHPLRQAAKYVAKGSRSPAESLLYGMFYLPHAYGGFNCRALKGGIILNHRINFSPRASHVASGMPYAICDAYIPAASTDMEYNGIVHELENSRIHDDKRNNGMQAMGIRVLAINREQMRDIPALEAIAQSLFKYAHTRFRYQIQGYRPRQEALLNGLRAAIGLPPA